MASDQADALAGGHGQVRVFEQWQQPEGEMGVEQRNTCHPHTITRPTRAVRAV